VVSIAGQTGVIPMLKSYGKVLRLPMKTNEQLEILAYVCNNTINRTLDLMVDKDYKELERRAPGAIARAKDALKKLKDQEKTQGAENVRQENGNRPIGI
jgi:hypothetical protein